MKNALSVLLILTLETVPAWAVLGHLRRNALFTFSKWQERADEASF